MLSRVFFLPVARMEQLGAAFPSVCAVREIY
jgi:hypothetical protein